uniref:Uncharacterized protein n=1 Tax=Arundo donax TaxID=35708 RepID=A0A0A9QIC7_ARUDO
MQAKNNTLICSSQTNTTVLATYHAQKKSSLWTVFSSPHCLTKEPSNRYKSILGIKRIS